MRPSTKMRERSDKIINAKNNGVAICRICTKPGSMFPILNDVCNSCRSKNRL